jgi:hypothetical protein
MRRQHALSSRFQRGTQKVELWGGTQIRVRWNGENGLFRRQARASFAATRRGSRRNRKSLAHLTRSRPSGEVASSSRSYQRLFSIVKRRPRRPCDILNSCRGYRARDFRARGASWPDFDQRPPGTACTDALDPKNPHSTLSHSGMTRWSP